MTRSASRVNQMTKVHLWDHTGPSNTPVYLCGKLMCNGDWGASSTEADVAWALHGGARHRLCPACAEVLNPMTILGLLDI